MTTYFLTFSSTLMHGSYWVRIVAPSYELARKAAFEHFDRRWSMIYDEERFFPALFPGGELFAFEVLDEHLNYRRIDERCGVAV